MMSLDPTQRLILETLRDDGRLQKIGQFLLRLYGQNGDAIETYVKFVPMLAPLVQWGLLVRILPRRTSVGPMCYVITDAGRAAIAAANTVPDSL